MRRRAGSSRRAAAAVWALTYLTLSACAGTAPATESSRSTPKLGMLRVLPDDDHAAFVTELRRQGWAAGTDVEIVPADPAVTVYTDEAAARAALRGWVREGIDLVVAFSTPFARLASEEASSTPVLFVVNDPVASGLVDDRRRPGANLTGVTFRTPADRTLDLAARVLGGVTTVGYLWPAGDPAVPGHRQAVLRAADQLRLEFVEASYDGPEAVAQAVSQVEAGGADVVVLANATATVQALDVLEQELDRRGLPAVANTDFARFAVVVVTPDGAEVRRQLARQAARLLAGAEVSAVPVEDPRKFTVVVNRTKLAQLGLGEVDADVLRRADVVR